MRVLHFTDVHVPIRFTDVPWRQLMGKRALGALNTQLRRLSKFRDASDKLARLAAFVRRERIDLVLCTGDFTVLGTELEYQAAYAAIAPLLAAPAGFVCVPGNHDLYVPEAVRARRFERFFGETLRTDWPEYAGVSGWPRILIVNDEVAVVSVNSARPNPQPWRSSGRIPDEDLRSFARLLADSRLGDRFVFVLTHYGPRRADGTSDEYLHGLENADELLTACASLRRGALLHGHIHHCYSLALDEPRIRIFNAGSTTYAGREGLWVFDVDGAQARATRGRWAGRDYEIDPSERYEL